MPFWDEKIGPGAPARRECTVSYLRSRFVLLFESVVYSKHLDCRSSECVMLEAASESPFSTARNRQFPAVAVLQGRSQNAPECHAPADVLTAAPILFDVPLCLRYSTWVTRRALSLVLLLVLPLAAPAQRRLTPAQLFTRYSALKKTVRPTGEMAERLGVLEQEGREAFQAGNTGELRRRMAHALTLLRGGEWGPLDDYRHSLILRTSMSVADPAEPFLAELGQIYPERSPGAERLRLHVQLAEMGRQSREGPTPGNILLTLAEIPALPADLIDEPARFWGDLAGVDDGRYLVVASVLSDSGTIHQVVLPIQIVTGIRTKRPGIEERLSMVDGSPAAKASILYPFDYARRANLGEVAARGEEIASSLARAEELLAALEEGENPLAPKPGSIERHYFFEQAEAIMPYRVHIPSAYDGETRLPLVIGLHGQGGTESGFFERDNQLFPRLAEQYGFIGVTVLGYTSTGGYGRQSENPDPVRARESRLSEKDVLNVLSRMQDEYLVDSERLFLMGHSMGGNGTWHLGTKYAEEWAAIAPIAAGQTPSSEDVQRLKDNDVAVFVAHGDADVVTPVEASRRAGILLNQLQVRNEYFELTAASHSSIVSPAMERIFAFFARQSARNADQLQSEKATRKGKAAPEVIR